jgi:hypothetical protein
MRNFQEDLQLYNIPNEVKSDCNSITIVNIGTATAIINGLEILPNAQYISLGNEGEINKTRYRLSFSGVGTEKVLVIRKVFI